MIDSNLRSLNEEEMAQAVKEMESAALSRQAAFRMGAR